MCFQRRCCCRRRCIRVGFENLPHAVVWGKWMEECHLEWMEARLVVALTKQHHHVGFFWPTLLDLAVHWQLSCGLSTIHRVLEMLWCILHPSYIAIMPKLYQIIPPHMPIKFLLLALLWMDPPTMAGCYGDRAVCGWQRTPCSPREQRRWGVGWGKIYGDFMWISCQFCWKLCCIGII